MVEQEGCAVFAEGPGWILHCGDYREVLADVTCDALITDPPYSARTHAAYEDAGDGSIAMGDTWNGKATLRTKAAGRRAIQYPAWSDDDIRGFCEWASPRTSGWVVAMTSHDLCASYESCLQDQGRYVFAPLPFVQTGSGIRLGGDGPSGWTCWVMVARPRSAAWLAERKRVRVARGDLTTLPGAYVGTPERGRIVVGGKSIDLMRAIIRDYSEPGDVVVDPCAGGATTLLAAVIENRKAIGAEKDPETFEKAVARLRRGFTPSMF
jgi:hypothetical protein